MLPRGVSITLVEPRGPVNLGHIARLVQNFGVEKLYLVEPKADLSVAAIYASHASGVLDRAVVTTFEKVRKENELLVATTAVRATKRSNVGRRMAKLERLHEILSSSAASSIVFGRDSTGLTNEEIRICDATVTIDTGQEYRSLNIGHAAAIVLYVASKGARGQKSSQGRSAREVFARSIFELAAASRMPKHKTRNLMDVAKRIAAASNMTDAQLNVLSGVFRKAVATMDLAQDLGSKT
ncbi:MAG TPA: RNA methyltransferase [Nitrososphaerales archaeon]|nr:RNA methyltransferase [Nitrososphaerales archaeon]